MRLNKPSPRLEILRTQLALRSLSLQCDRMMYASSAQNPRMSRAPMPVAADLPLPPSYDEDLAEWLRERAAPESGGSSAPPEQPSVAAPRIPYSVCVKEYYGIKVGEVFAFIPHCRMEDHWLPCDRDGWIAHIPTPTSECPVPDGLRAWVRWRDGTEHSDYGLFRWHEQVPGGHCSDIVAWRPVRGGK